MAHTHPGTCTCLQTWGPSTHVPPVEVVTVSREGATLAQLSSPTLLELEVV